ncbi:Uncharacterized conserved protein YbaA, DUF1428 family [Rhodovulum sp. ES.010]|uniref:DUF1428 domain-containing protein n=1 Tax=Rhodovulum sp. ES.010 TaxID=1882821 RepID=UPI000929ED3C|nr:DUF1428 domain-containing protein [Rhodovulum sp. ES.010]SIO06763.1 Uncharacterized conserved protein YbaA, DUF1428 family [Rhodovulum sp. ES.010]
MPCVDGVVSPVPDGKKSACLDHAAAAWPLFRAFGALAMLDCWGDEVPESEVTSFPMAVKTEPGDKVVLSWTAWPDKATRDAGWAKTMEDPRMAEVGVAMPFGGKRMILGGFAPMLAVGTMPAGEG